MKQSSAAVFAWEKNEQIQLQHTGTGTPNTTKHEWRTHQYRDTLATMVMTPGLLTYQSMGLEESEAIVRTQLIDKMVQPCGPAPIDVEQQMIENVKFVKSDRRGDAFFTL